jgi:hypothetical protein
MASFLKDHPFAVEAFFDSSLVLTYAVPKDELRSLIPDCLELDTFSDRWAFVAAAMVQTRELRPRGFPKFLGSNFFLIGYRVFVRFRDVDGKRSRGLYILGSATNKRRMEFFGNIFTHYRYTTTDISHTENAGMSEIESKSSRFQVEYKEPNERDVPLPAGSVFADWKEARRFAGPLPFTFTYEPGDDSVLVIEGVRTNWKPVPVEVVDHEFSFIRDLRLDDTRLSNAFMIKDVPYYWKKGKRLAIPK